MSQSFDFDSRTFQINKIVLIITIPGPCDSIRTGEYDKDCLHSALYMHAYRDCMAHKDNNCNCKHIMLFWCTSVLWSYNHLSFNNNKVCYYTLTEHMLTVFQTCINRLLFCLI